jgi:predicted nicotinamide N-methyase
VSAASAALRASLAEQLGRLRDAPVPDALSDALLERVDVGAGAGLLRARPRSFDDVREAEALVGPGRPTPYWSSAWPSGTVLARCVAAAGDLTGRRVVELGCGLGLPSVAAARAGADVLATDVAPEAVVYAAHNLALNGLAGDVAVADWEAVAELGPRDLVLGADVLYLEANARALARLLPRMVAPGGEVWLADPGRAGCRAFLAMARAQWTVRSAPDDERPDVRVHRLTARSRSPS